MQNRKGNSRCRYKTDGTIALIERDQTKELFRDIFFILIVPFLPKNVLRFSITGTVCGRFMQSCLQALRDSGERQG